MKTLIAIPCYNCEKQIKRVIDSILQKKINQSNNILIIDNQSTDNTLEVIRTCINKKNNFTLIQNLKNYGLGGSHKVAFNFAIENDFHFITILHGDDQASISDYPKLLNNSKHTNHSTLGSRFMFKSKRFGYQKTRTIGNILLNIVFTILTLKPTKDLGSGINTFATNDLKLIDYQELTDSFNFNVELLLSFYKKDICVSFLPIIWSEKDQISNAKNISVAISMLKSLFYYRFSLPLKSREDLKDYNYKQII